MIFKKHVRAKTQFAGFLSGMEVGAKRPAKNWQKHHPNQTLGKFSTGRSVFLAGHCFIIAFFPGRQGSFAGGFSLTHKNHR